ncbi:hypothetical protein ABG067_007935 [Albugo candida]
MIVWISHDRLHRHYNIRYFVESHQIEIFDTKTNKLFLKRTECPASASGSDFYVGAKVCVFARTFELLDYLDASTREILGVERQHSVLIVNGAGISRIGGILDTLERQGFMLSAVKLMQIPSKEAEDFYNAVPDQPKAAQSIASLVNGPIVSIEIVASNCVEKLAHLVSFGPLLKSVSANSSYFEYPKTVSEAEHYRNFFIRKLHNSVENGQNCTCAVILPHIVKNKLTGKVIEAVQEYPESIITAMESFHLDRASAVEFLEVYDGVLPHYNDTVEHLVSGLCVAIRLEGTTDNIVPDFRTYVGPWDVDMAKKLSPHTIRAKFGLDRVCNAVHCTDLPDDGASECDFFFNILSKHKEKASNL